jgi:GTP-binding protein
MLVDEAEIEIRAGNGGDGRISFRKAKFIPKGGPDGGSGGNGGDFYFIGTADLGALRKFRFQKKFNAEDGREGGKGKKTGGSGQAKILEIPVGTFIKDLETGESWEIEKGGEKILVAKGGIGGKGNWSFRSATLQAPQFARKGTLGQKRKLFLELRLIADIGLIGLPNAGKSSLLSKLTRARVKVAPYPFTTLEPNLGVMNGLILADLPGLIEGASNGRGLGFKFLRHIKRTKILVHCLSLETTDALKDYQIIRKELGEYQKELLAKPEIILLTKSDLVSKKELGAIGTKLAFTKREVLSCSIYDFESLKTIKERLKSHLVG